MKIDDVFYWKVKMGKYNVYVSFEIGLFDLKIFGKGCEIWN